MRAGLDPFSFVVTSIAGWMNQRQQQVIEYLVEVEQVTTFVPASTCGNLGNEFMAVLM
jgi:hypothetical protein